MTLTEVGMHLSNGDLQLSDHVKQKSSRRANDALGRVEQRKFKYGGFA